MMCTSVGETQSKPGLNNIEATVAQAGIYATGYLAKTGLSKCVTMVLTKNKRALILASTQV